MAVSHVGSATAASSSVSLPAFTPGDVALVIALRSSDGTVPSLPSGWNDAGTLSSGSNYGARLGWRVLQSGDTTTGTWTNAENVAVTVYTGVHQTLPFDWTSGSGNNGVFVGGTSTSAGGSTGTLNDAAAIVLNFYLGTTSISSVSGLLTTRAGGVGSTYVVADGDPAYWVSVSMPSTDYSIFSVGLRPASTFPIIADQDTINGTVTSNSTSWTLTYPTNIAAGDLILALIAADGSLGTVNSASGWNIWKQNSSANGLTILGKIADGTETGTFGVTLSSSEQGSWATYRIPAATWEGSALPGDGSLVGSINSDSMSLLGTYGADANPDPPSLDPANWAAEDTLWLAVCSADTSRTVSAYPSSPDTFTNTGYLASGGNNGSTLGWARLEKNASSVDPGTYTISTSDDWVAATIAIRPYPATATQTILPTLLDGARTIYAPTVLPQPITIGALGLLDGSAAIYAPTVVGLLPSQTVGAVDLLDGGSTIYAPTVLPGPVTVAPDLLDGSAALYAPTLTPEATIGVLDLADGAAAVFAPAVAPYSTLDLVLLDSGPALYAPTLIPGPVTADLGLLDSGPAIYALTAQRVLQLVVGLLDGAANVYAPTVLPQPVTVGTLGLLDGGPTAYAPTVTPYVTLAPDLLDGTAAAYAPTLAPYATLSLSLLDGASAAYVLTVQPGPVTLGALDLIDGAAAIYDPTLAVGPISVSLTLADGGALVYAPTILPGPIGADLPLLDGIAAIYSPTASLSGAPQALDLGLVDSGRLIYNLAAQPAPVDVSLSFLDAAGAIYSPTIQPLSTFALGLLDGASSLYDLTLTPQPVTLGPLDLLDGASALYAPALIQGAATQALDLSLVDATAAIYELSLTAKATLTLGLLDGQPIAYSLTVLPQAVTADLGLLDTISAVYAPSLQSYVEVGLILAVSVPELYQPTLITGPVTIPLALLDSFGALYDLTVRLRYEAFPPGTGALLAARTKHSAAANARTKNAAAAQVRPKTSSDVSHHDQPGASIE